MNLTEREGTLIHLALPLIAKAPVIEHILGGTYLRGKEEEKNRTRLDAYRKEAILSALLTPLAKLFFIGRADLYSNPNLHKELAGYMISQLDNWFIGNFTSSINKGLKKKSKK